MAEFEGFNGQTGLPAAKDVFTIRNPNGPINTMPSPGNGALPPGHNVFRKNESPKGKTPSGFLKKIGD